MQLSPTKHFTDSSNKKVRPCCSLLLEIRDAVLCKCRSEYVKRQLLEEREELTLALTLEIAEQCENLDHLSVSELSKEDANRVYETPKRPDGKQKRKKNGIRRYRFGLSGAPGWRSKMSC